MDEVELPGRIGPYEILRKIGAGGMGTVFLGRHAESKIEAAVKVLPSSLAREAGTVNRFEREIDAMRQLTGSHIVKLYESGHDKATDQMYFAMEFVKGRTLTELILAERRLPWDQAVDIAIQICSALKTAHAAGVVHRDLKPSNLLIGDNGVVKLTDFGVAQVFAAQRLTVTGGIIGTAEYMSPEQAQGRRCTRVSDLYSLGAVLYVMLTGRPPFTGRNAVEIIQKHSTSRFDRPGLYVPDLPRSLEDVVCRLLEKNPEDRYSDAHVVSLRLKEVVKRVELASRDETVAKSIESDGLTSPTATASSPGHFSGTEDVTFAAGVLEAGDQSADPRHGADRHGPGSATMMRDAFRAEIMRDQEKSRLATLFDNTWFLLACLALLIAGGFFWMDGADEDSSLADSPGLAADEADVQSEVARFMRLAKSYRRSGDLPREERLLEALRTVIADDDSNTPTRLEIEQRLEVIREQRQKQQGESGLAQQTLDRATALADNGQDEVALRLLDSLFVLFGEDEAAQPQLDLATELIGRINSTARGPEAEGTVAD